MATTLATAKKISATTHLLAMLASSELARELETFVTLCTLILIGKIEVKATRDNYFISRVNREKLYARDNHRCFYCGVSTNLSLDHIVPQHKGINHSFDNLITACRSCNSSKQHQPLNEWLTKQHIIGKCANVTAKEIIQQAKKVV